MLLFNWKLYLRSIYVTLSNCKHSIRVRSDLQPETKQFGKRFSTNTCNDSRITIINLILLSKTSFCSAECCSDTLRDSSNYFSAIFISWDLQPSVLWYSWGKCTRQRANLKSLLKEDRGVKTDRINTMKGFSHEEKQKTTLILHWISGYSEIVGSKKWYRLKYLKCIAVQYGHSSPSSSDRLNGIESVTLLVSH